METKRRRRSTTKRRTTAARRNPTATITRRKRRTRRANPTSFASTRRRTSRRRSVNRRRNPSAGGLITQAGALALGMTAVGVVGGFVPPIGGGSPIAVAARQAATGWLVGEGMQRFGVMRAYASDVKIGGAVLGLSTLINYYLLPTISGFFRPAPKAVPVDANGNALAGIAPIYRGMQPYRMYSNNGMGGIAVIDPAQQPYGEYAS